MIYNPLDYSGLIEGLIKDAGQPADFNDYFDALDAGIRRKQNTATADMTQTKADTQREIQKAFENMTPDQLDSPEANKSLS